MAASPPSRVARRVPAVKFCGLTRNEDAASATALGARYLGVILASGPRLRTTEQARSLFDSAPGTYGRVGVFGSQDPAAIIGAARDLELDVVQLHADPSAEGIDALRRAFAGEVWAVVRVAGTELPRELGPLFRTADAVVLDAKVPGRLGGTGVALDWTALAGRLDGPRTGGRLVLAGGLTSENVARAARLLSPDVVDVSSGVERAPGVKDAALMAAFVAALG